MKSLKNLMISHPTLFEIAGAVFACFSAVVVMSITNPPPTQRERLKNQISSYMLREYPGYSDVNLLDDNVSVANLSLEGGIVAGKITAEVFGFGSYNGVRDSAYTVDFSSEKVNDIKVVVPANPNERSYYRSAHGFEMAF